MSATAQPQLSSDLHDHVTTRKQGAHNIAGMHVYKIARTASVLVAVGSVAALAGCSSDPAPEAGSDERAAAAYTTDLSGVCPDTEAITV